jgi:hypothetical protein
VSEELVFDKSFIETRNFLRAHLISNIRKKLQDRFTILASHSIETRRTKSKGLSANQYNSNFQDSCSSDEDSVVVPPTKATMVCNLAQIPPEIWVTLPLEAMKWLLNERKRQQQEDDKMKNS